ncbi:hypothetical protein [Neptuniibacter pectenicola]|uniref:hypothetical protein n=1 Tax=Neptuniibacter pectenicola TaxID=1806669 RepID=UPI0008346F45|nr:hypothetical protein [Neptuniibacter pectenicola]
MKLYLSLIIATLFSLPVLANESVEEPQYMAFGMGITNCVEVNQNFDKENFQFVLKVWLTGYMTAVNSVLKDQPIGLSSSDMDDSLKSIRLFCTDKSNMQASIGEAAETFWRVRVAELATKAAK